MAWAKLLGSALLSAFIVMILIFVIKKGADKWNIPLVKTIADGV